MMTAPAKKAGLLPIVLGGIVAFVGASVTLNGLIFALVGCVFAVVFPVVFGLPLEDMALDERGRSCPGTVTEVRYDASFQVNGEDTVRVEYRYEAGGDREGDVRFTASDPLARLEVGDPVTVEYLPEDPGASRIQGGKAAIAGWAGVAGIGCFCAALAGTVSACAVLAAGLGVVGIGVKRRRSAGAAEAGATSAWMTSKEQG